jgi:hypothetical protein
MAVNPKSLKLPINHVRRAGTFKHLPRRHHEPKCKWPSPEQSRRKQGRGRRTINQDVRFASFKSKVKNELILLARVLALTGFEGVKYIQWDHEKGSVMKYAPPDPVQQNSYASHQQDKSLKQSLIVVVYLDGITLQGILMISGRQTFRHLDKTRGLIIIMSTTLYPQTLPPRWRTT